MNNGPEICLKPHASGLFWAAIIVVSVMTCCTWLMIGYLTISARFRPHGDMDGLLVFFGLVYAVTMMICVDMVLDIIRTAMTGLRPQWQLRITSEGIHHPLLFGQTLGWDEIESIYVSNGWNGKDIYFILSASSWRMNLLNAFVSLATRKRTGYFIVKAHRFSFSTSALLDDLRQITPGRLGFGYRLT